jgi:glycosyltransferase involved in cell wall biosynthesis
LYSGRVNRAKGIDLLLRTFINLPKSLNVKLLIIGSSIYGRTLEDSFLEKLKGIANIKKEDVVFTGYINYDDVPMFHAISDIAVIPSMYNEAAGLVVIEAMSSGLPIIATDSGGIPELVSEDCSFIIRRSEHFVEDLEKSLEVLIRDKELRKSMGNNSYKRSILFGKDEYCNNFNKLLKNI